MRFSHSIVGICAAAFVLVPVVFVAACSSSSSSGSTSGALTCPSPGAAATGPADTHCGSMVQSVSAASCTVTDAGTTTDNTDAGPDAGATPADSCDYGATMAGQEGDDDDCKYHVKWTSTDICEGTAGATFTVTVTSKTDGKPVTGIPNGVRAEIFLPTDPNAACDDVSMHPGPVNGGSQLLAEQTPGSGVYVGQVSFDAKGVWTVRFHIHEECADILDDSPHGHAAFHIDVP